MHTGMTIVLNTSLSGLLGATQSSESEPGQDVPANEMSFTKLMDAFSHGENPEGHNSENSEGLDINPLTSLEDITRIETADISATLFASGDVELGSETRLIDAALLPSNAVSGNAEPEIKNTTPVNVHTIHSEPSDNVEANASIVADRPTITGNASEDTHIPLSAQPQKDTRPIAEIIAPNVGNKTSAQDVFAPERVAVLEPRVTHGQLIESSHTQNPIPNAGHTIDEPEPLGLKSEIPVSVRIETTTTNPSAPQLNASNTQPSRNVLEPTFVDNTKFVGDTKNAPPVQPALSIRTNTEQTPTGDVSRSGSFAEITPSDDIRLASPTTSKTVAPPTYVHTSASTPVAQVVPSLEARPAPILEPAQVQTLQKTNVAPLEPAHVDPVRIPDAARALSGQSIETVTLAEDTSENIPTRRSEPTLPAPILDEPSLDSFKPQADKIEFKMAAATAPIATDVTKFVAEPLPQLFSASTGLAESFSKSAPLSTTVTPTLTQGAQPAALQTVAQNVIQAVVSQTGVSVRLDPPEMGNVSITFQFDAERGVTAIVRSELVETSIFLKERAEILQQTLKDSGFDSVNLSFEQGHTASDHNDSSPQNLENPASMFGKYDASEDVSTASLFNYNRNYVVDDQIDLRL